VGITGRYWGEWPMTTENRKKFNVIQNSLNDLINMLEVKKKSTLLILSDIQIYMDKIMENERRGNGSNLCDLR